jgi:hypothetical protein
MSNRNEDDGATGAKCEMFSAKMQNAKIKKYAIRVAFCPSHFALVTLPFHPPAEP